MISPKISTTTVHTAVEMVDAMVSRVVPCKSSMKNSVLTVASRMLTTLLPTRMVEIKRSYFSAMASVRVARLFPFSAKVLSLVFERVEKAVSVAEK